VQHISICNSLYNVVSGYNDRFYTSLGIANLIPGYYNTTTFTDMLEGALKAVDAGFTVNYEINPKKLDITNATPFAITFGTNKQRSAAKICGFNGIDTVVDVFHRANHVINLVWAHSLIIEIQEANNRISSSDVQSSSRGSIYIPFNVPFGTYQNLYESDLHQMLSFSKNTRKLSVRIYNSDNEPAD
jgi:hypothetical protein